MVNNEDKAIAFDHIFKFTDKSNIIILKYNTTLRVGVDWAYVYAYDASDKDDDINYICIDENRLKAIDAALVLHMNNTIAITNKEYHALAVKGIVIDEIFKQVSLGKTIEWNRHDIITPDECIEKFIVEAELLGNGEDLENER